MTMYIITKYPMKMLAMAKKGEMRGLNMKEATTDQSSVNAPTPRPLRPEPIWCAVTEWGKIQHIHEML